MNNIKAIAAVIILCGFISCLVPEISCKYAIEAIVVFAMCIYAMDTISYCFADFDFDKEALVNDLEFYTEHVQDKQKRLFDHIASEEQVYETD